MNDDVKAAIERFHTWEFDGLDARDHATLLAHIDGEPARIAAAVADASSAALRAMSRAVKAEVRVAELERTLKERDEQSLFEGQREHEWNASFNATVIERAEKAEAERDEKETERAALETALMAFKARFAEVLAERDALRARVDELKLALGAERDRHDADGKALMRAQAQVEAARTYARQALDYGEDCDATDLLAAMDEAKP
jgi:chromosome segregation ATPase